MVVYMKNKKSKFGINPALLASGLKYCFFIYCLMLMPFDLLTFVTGTASASTEQMVEYKLKEDTPSDSNDLKVQPVRHLLQSDIAPVTNEKDRKKSDELKSLIEQIRAVKIQPQEQIPVLVAAPKIIPADEPEPNEVPSVTEKPATPEKTNIEPILPYNPISGETLQKLRSLSQNPQQIDEPLELGELLFHSGYYKEAVLFYREALRRTGLNSPDTVTDRAWILFQIANCLRNSDMPEAVRTYGQLISEFPNSFWADMALIQNQFIAWYQKDEPQKLINENKPQNIGTE